MLKGRAAAAEYKELVAEETMISVRAICEPQVPAVALVAGILTVSCHVKMGYGFTDLDELRIKNSMRQ